jgi:hypothetical protein
MVTQKMQLLKKNCTFLLLAESSACFTKAVPSLVTCCKEKLQEHALSPEDAALNSCDPRRWLRWGASRWGRHRWQPRSGGAAGSHSWAAPRHNAPTVVLGPPCSPRPSVGRAPSDWSAHHLCRRRTGARTRRRGWSLIWCPML